MQTKPKGHFGSVRCGWLFAAGMAGACTGTLIPLETMFFDIAIILLMCLTGSVVFIGLTGRDISQVKSFPLMVVGVATLQMTAAFSFARLMLVNHSAGQVVTSAANLAGFLQNASAGFAVISIIVVACFLAAAWICRTAVVFVTEVAVCRNIKLNSELEAGVISNDTALARRELIEQESSFLSASRSASKFVGWTVLVQTLVLLTVMAVAISEHENRFSMAAVAGSLIPGTALLSIMSLAGTNIRIYNRALSECVEVSSEKIRVAVREYAPQANVDTKPATSEIAGLLGSEPEAEDVDWAEDIEMDTKALPIWDWKKIGEREYTAISDWLSGSDQAKVTVMAASSPDELGVTIPVNVGMRLAKQGKKVLLVDMDLERDAIAKVFEVDTTQDKEIFATCVKNMWVRPAHAVRGECGVKRLERIVKKLSQKIDCVIAYVPSLDSLDNEKLALISEIGVLFASGDDVESKSVANFYGLLVAKGAKILEPIV